MYQYLNVTRLRTYGGEGVLPKLLRIESRAMKMTMAKRAEWEASKPSAAEMAGSRTLSLPRSWRPFGKNSPISKKRGPGGPEAIGGSPVSDRPAQETICEGPRYELMRPAAGHP